jgi:hypothetical protein
LKLLLLLLLLLLQGGHEGGVNCPSHMNPIKTPICQFVVSQTAVRQPPFTGKRPK